MKRREFLKTLGLAGAVSAIPNIHRHVWSQDKSKRPNIVFLFSDDHAQRAISAYAAEKAILQTPNIDRIAREGILFRRSYCGNSICAPSRATILTGLHSHANGQLDNKGSFDGSQQTFPKLLQAAGYQTAIRGKWHLKSEPTGFDSWMVYPGQGQYINPVYRTPAGSRQIEGYSTDVTTDLAIQWLREERDPGRPFYLAVQFKAPHRPFLPPVRHLDTFENADFPEPPTLFDDYAGRAGALSENAMSIKDSMRLNWDLKYDGRQWGGWTRWFKDDQGEWLEQYKAHYQKRAAELMEKNPQGKDLVRWKWRAYLEDYLGAAKAVDDCVGRVLDALKEAHLEDNTLVVYSSDQGFYLGEHGWFDKRWVYEESFSMPLVMRLPGVIAPGTVSDALVQNIDYAPTFCALAGAPIPHAMHGRSLETLFDGKPPGDWRDSLYYAYYEYPRPHHVAPHEAVANARYKLIRFPRTDEWELLDRQVDPLEVKNFYGDPEYAQIQASLKKELARLREKFDVPEDYPKAFPLKENKGGKQ